MDEQKMGFVDRVKNFVLGHKIPSIVVAAVVCIAVIAGVVIGISACRKSNTQEPETEQTTPVPTTVAQTEPETETETEADTGLHNPLTGEMTETDISKNRPYCVMLNSIYQALPQRGNSQADILIEMMEEGGITRVVGIYQDIDGVGEVGAIRSTREYFYSWVLAFDGIDVHAGGDYWVLEKLKASGYPSLDCLENAGGAFYRDAERQKIMSNEHTMFTSSDNLLAMTERLGMRKELDDDLEITKLSFTEDGTPDGPEATRVTVPFSGYKNTRFIYNEETGLYDIEFFDNPYVDEAADFAQVAVTNVLVLPVPNWMQVDGWGINRQKYDMTGGTGYYFNGGHWEEITWEKGDYNKEEEYANPLHLYDAEGNVLKLGVGKTYICVINEYNEVLIEPQQTE